MRLVYRLIWKGKKLLIPGIISESLQKAGTFLVHPSVQSLYGLQELECRPEASVILTDSIEVAHRCNFELTSIGNTDYSWCSWYSDSDSDSSSFSAQVKALDLSPLKKRTVYYLVKAHSGMDEETAIKRALVCSQVFDEQGLKDVRYVTWLKGEENYFTRHPEWPVEARVFSKSEFIKIFSEERKAVDNETDQLRKYLFDRRGNTQRLLTPLLNEGTRTIIHGPKDCGKTWFSMSLAMCLAKGC